MRKYTNMILFLLCICSCAKEALLTQETPYIPVGNYIELEVNAEDLIQTKGEFTEDLENKLESVQYFIFPRANDQETAPSLACVRSAVLSANQMTRQPGTNRYRLIIDHLDETMINEQLFARSNRCFIYVIANKTIQNQDNYNAIRNSEVSSNFVNELNENYLFVMDGLGDIALKPNRSATDKTIGSGSVTIRRLAVKTTINIQVSDTLEGADEDSTVSEVWTIDKNNIRVELRNGNNAIKLDGGTIEGSHFSHSSSRIFGSADEDSGYQTTAQALYSYPMEWDPGSPEEPYLHIIVPCTSGSKRKNSHYKVLLSGTEYLRNTWHEIYLTIDVLGSWTEEAPTVTVKDVYYFVWDWKHARTSTGGSETEEHSIDAVIKDARYLVVAKKDYEIKNLRDLTFSAISSHDIEIVDIQIKQWNTKTRQYKQITGKDGWITRDGFKITIETELMNIKTGTSLYDVTPYIIDFKIRHIDSPDVFVPIHVVQYPAIHIEAEENSDYPNNGKRNDHKGYVYVNNGQETTKANWDYVAGLTGGNKNQDMHIITITALDANTKCDDGHNYVISDPRSETAHTFTNTLKKDDNNMAYNANGHKYYPTNSATPHYIAPKLRVASSYGVTQRLSETNAIERCAAYQEDGFPAGRWRLPSYAEFNFIIKLSGDGKIDELFANNNPYWTGNGLYIYDTSNANKKEVKKSDDTTGNVRCVYDEWYWGDGQIENREKFVWGNE